MKQKTDWLNVVKYAGAYIAFIIGSGFATGQEIIQFYTSYGIWGIGSIAISMFLFAWVGGTVTDIIYNESGDFSAYVYVITPDEENDMLDLGGIEVVFDVYSRLDTVIVPQKAVKKLDGRNYVNLLVDGVKIEQDVELGIEDNDNVEILSGLSGGEEIILN